MIEPDEPGTHSRKKVGTHSKKRTRNAVGTHSEKRKKIRFNVALDPDFKERVDSLCEKLGMERNTFVLRALKRYVRYKQGNKK